MTFLAALRHDRIAAPWLLDGPINGERFLVYIEEVLVPTILPGDAAASGLHARNDTVSSGIMRAMRDDTQRSGLERIGGELVKALSAITSVRNVDSIGSIATDCADQWSDVDLLISCEVPERTAWLAAAAIRSAKRGAFYRMFTGVAQPSGRYWFWSESPFRRLGDTDCS